MHHRETGRKPGSAAHGKAGHAPLPWRHRSCLSNALLHSPARGICATLFKNRPVSVLVPVSCTRAPPVWHASEDGPSLGSRACVRTRVASRSRARIFIITQNKVLAALYLRPPPSPPHIFLHFDLWVCLLTHLLRVPPIYDLRRVLFASVCDSNCCCLCATTNCPPPRAWG